MNWSKVSNQEALDDTQANDLTERAGADQHQVEPAHHRTTDEHRAIKTLQKP